MARLSNESLPSIYAKSYATSASAGQTVINPGFSWNINCPPVVYIDGLKQSQTAYTISYSNNQASSLTLSEGLAGGEVIEVIAYDMSGLQIATSSSSYATYSLTTSSGSLSANTIHLLLSSTGGTYNLPASPINGTIVELVDVKRIAQTYNVTVNRNGKTILGNASNYVIKTNGVALGFVYDDTNANWALYKADNIDSLSSSSVTTSDVMSMVIAMS